MKPIPKQDNRQEATPLGERRKNKRFDTVMTYVLVLDSTEYTGLIENISLSGAYLGTFQPMITLDKLSKEGEIALFVDEGFAIRIRCQITYVGSGQGQYLNVVGLDFIDPNIDAIAAIIDTDI